jgi:hypothetical protein
MRTVHPSERWGKRSARGKHGLGARSRDVSRVPSYIYVSLRPGGWIGLKARSVRDSDGLSLRVYVMAGLGGLVMLGLSTLYMYSGFRVQLVPFLIETQYVIIAPVFGV